MALLSQYDALQKNDSAFLRVVAVVPVEDLVRVIKEFTVQVVNLEARYKGKNLHRLRKRIQTRVMLCHIETGVTNPVMGAPHCFLEVQQSSLMKMETFLETAFCELDISKAMKNSTCSAKHIFSSVHTVPGEDCLHHCLSIIWAK